MAMQRRDRSKQAATLETRLEEEASRLRARAVEMPPGHEREIVLRKLREIEMTCGLTDWINSPGLQPPS
jgi:hypothetical protein